VLIHLNVCVDVAHKFERGEEGERAQHEKERVADEWRVAEELNQLQRAEHVWTLEVVEYGVDENKQSGWSVKCRAKWIVMNGSNFSNEWINEYDVKEWKYTSLMTVKTHCGGKQDNSPRKLEITLNFVVTSPIFSNPSQSPSPLPAVNNHQI